MVGKLKIYSWIDMRHIIILWKFLLEFSPALIIKKSKTLIDYKYRDWMHIRAYGI